MKNLITTSKKLSIVFLCAAFMAACDSSATQTGSGTAAPVSTAAAAVQTASGVQLANLSLSDLVTFGDDDYAADWSNENPVMVKLAGTSATIEGSGAAVSGGTVTINAAGTYVLSGELTDGQIVVDVPDDGDVRLVLNGASISSSGSAGIYVKQAGNAVITAQEATENSVSDGTGYVSADVAEDSPNAAIFSMADLTINGTGTLNVTGNTNNGITSKDDLKIAQGTLKVKAVDDGILGRDMVAVGDAGITVEAGGDGITSTNDTDTTKGFVAIADGTFDITAGSDGIQSEMAVVIEGGTFNLVTGGGNANGEVKTENGPGGFTRDSSSTDTTAAAAEDSESTSAKGIKAAGDISIKGGAFTIDSADDSIHSSSDIVIAGGTFGIASGDDGMHADTSLTVTGGTIDVTKSYEGLEASTLNIAGGESRVVSSDDGVNAGGGANAATEDAGGQQDPFSSTGNNLLNITGGYLTVNAEGDGLDANGSIQMSGGTVIVSGPTSSGNGALDYDSTFEQTGGILVAAGSEGMVKAPSEDSAQYSIGMSFTQTQAAGTLVHLEDSDGNAILTLAPEKQFQSVIISSPDLKSGGAYTLYTGGSSTGTAKGGLYTGGEYTGGTKVVSFELSGSVTWVNESGVTTAPAEMGGGPGGMGGGRPDRGSWDGPGDQGDAGESDDAMDVESM